MTPFDPAHLLTAQLSDVGRARSENQDACQEFRSPSGARLLAVADGMGGHQGGATASRLAIETLAEVFAETPDADAETLRTALERANQRVYQAAQERPELHGMGTTCVALLFGAKGSAWVAHVGDSRAYALRAGQIEQLTADHSTVAELVRLGKITPEEAAVHPRRNEILRSIGAESSVEVDVALVDVQAGDQFLLCSDGLSGVLTDQEIGAVILREPPEQAVRLLVDFANERGGPDNVTAVVTAVPEAAEPAPPGREVGAREWQSEEALAASRRKLRQITALVAVIAGLLAIVLLLLVLTSSELSVDQLRALIPVSTEQGAPTPEGAPTSPDPDAEGGAPATDAETRAFGDEE
jgi:protein phosphatase